MLSRGTNLVLVRDQLGRPIENAEVLAWNDTGVSIELPHISPGYMHYSMMLLFQQF